MKKLIFALAMMLPLMGRAEEKNVLAGKYAGCAVSLESTTALPKSVFYIFTFGEDSSLDITAEYYDGTEKCDRKPVGHEDYDHFEVMDDTGNGPGRFITASEVNTPLFFKFVIAKSYAAITSSRTYPVTGDFVDSMVLDRVP